MIIIKIEENETGLFTDAGDMNNILQAILVELENRHFLTGLHEGFLTACNTNTIQFEFKGFVMGNKNASNYIVRSLSIILDEIGLTGICRVTSITNQAYFGDKVVPLESFKPENTRNTNLLKGFINDDAIPELFKCQISDQVMDEPVHTKSRPDIYYDKKHLTYWLYSQDKIIDPLTRTPLRLTSDVIEDTELKDKIYVFVQDQVKIGLKKKQNNENEKIIKIVKKYASEITQFSINKAFRASAADNDVEAMGILVMKVSSINSQDDNPQRRRTALHWAVIKNATKSVEWLLQIGAEVNISDAAGKTALDYAKQSNNQEIKSLLMGEMKQPSQILRAANSR